MIELSYILEVGVFVALLAAMMVLLVKKWGIAEWMQVHGDKFLSKLFSCDLCMSFWAAMCFAAALCCYMDSPEWLLLPFLTTPLTRMLV